MIDWAHVARHFWTPNTDDLAWIRSVSGRFNLRDADCKHAAHRIDNLGRALAGAGMLAMVEARTEERAYAIARQSLNWRRP